MAPAGRVRRLHATRQFGKIATGRINDDVGVRSIFPFLSDDSKRGHCLPGAPSPDAIREAACKADPGSRRPNGNASVK